MKYPGKLTSSDTNLSSLDSNVLFLWILWVNCCERPCFPANLEQLQLLFLLTYALNRTHHEQESKTNNTSKITTRSTQIGKKIHCRYHGRPIHPPAASPTRAMTPPQRKLSPKMCPHRTMPLQLCRPTAIVFFWCRS